jgi:hypothetical protein
VVLGLSILAGLVVLGASTTSALALSPGDSVVAHGEPRTAPWPVIEKSGGNDVAFTFGNQQSIDPNIAPTGVSDELKRCTNTGDLLALIKSFSFPKKPFMNEGGTQARRKLAEEQLQQLTACAEEIFTR